MSQAQAGILQPLPPLSRYLAFSLEPDSDVAAGLAVLQGLVDGDRSVAGIGLAPVSALGRKVAGLKPFPPLAGPGVDIPSTPVALWLWLRGDDRGELLHRARRLEAALAPVFRLEESIDGFKHAGGRDLSGYEDGTENPEGEAALAAAIAADGSSFVAVQRWVHNFKHFEAMQPEERDDCIGRRRSDNEELDDAPASAHVKRTAQESFSPEAFVLRRSMPWVEGKDAGLMFVAFGHSVDAFQAQMRRMVGLEDGIVDALFRFTRPVTGTYLWCPPVKDGRLDLSALLGKA
ncbi:Dyp-type peroxidase [Zoogloea dura]|uniref:Dyp-type peroxidase n=1 Tax=Zoogloea dura TaxID=2728840 RepID=A0A848G656_9RHOO|nr:Dyp-type peroxidase [Zoogloea dura]NML26406.1 Dyp-type peroxidase [Zoogloea dura]